MGLSESPTCDEWFSVDDDADEPTVTTTVLEFHLARRGRKESVVAAPPHILPRVELRAALLEDDGPRAHELPTEALDAQALRIRIAPVSRTAYTFLV